MGNAAEEELGHKATLVVRQGPIQRRIERWSPPPFAAGHPEESIRRRRTTSDLLLVGVVFVVVATLHLFGQKIWVNGGFGWDGIRYGTWALDFHRAIFVDGQTAYSLGRFLPSGVIHYTLRLLGVPLTHKSVVVAFTLMNIGLVTLTAWLWCLVARRLLIGIPGAWLGALALFGNHAVLKWSSYYPVLTDMPAFALGMGMVYCYLRGYGRALWLLTAMGAFTWPTLLYMGGFLLLFPATPPSAKPAGRVVQLLVAILPALALCLAVCYMDRIRLVIPDEAVQPIRPLLGVSLAVAAAYVVLAGMPLLARGDLYRPGTWLQAALSRRGIALAILLVGVEAVRIAFANGRPCPDTGQVLLLTGYLGVTRPAIFLVSHVVFFGPIVLLAVGSWPASCARISEQGPGLAMAAYLGVLLGVDCESRHLVNFLPLFVPFVVKATEGMWDRRRSCIAFALLSLLVSKVWLPIRLKGYGTLPLSFPDQTMFMSLGKWMSTPMYLVQGALVLAVAAWVWRQKPEGPGMRDEGAGG
jgi:hypothetical protein